MSLRYKFCILMSVTISAWKWCSVRLNLELFVERLMSYLRCLCLFPYSGVQHILCCVFVLSFFVLCALWCQFLWIVNFWLPLPYSLTFIYTNNLLILVLNQLRANGTQQKAPQQQSNTGNLISFFVIMSTNTVA